MSDHPLHARLAVQLSEPLRQRRVVVWYDPHGTYRGFIAELRAKASGAGPVVGVRIGAVAAGLAEWAGSYFGLRGAVEPLTDGERPEPLLIYLPIAPEKLSPLLELEKA